MLEMIAPAQLLDNKKLTPVLGEFSASFTRKEV